MQRGFGGPLRNYWGPLIFRHSPVTLNKVYVAPWKAVWPVLRTTALRHFDTPVLQAVLWARSSLKSISRLPTSRWRSMCLANTSSCAPAQRMLTWDGHATPQNISLQPRAGTSLHLASVLFGSLEKWHAGVNTETRLTVP